MIDPDAQHDPPVAARRPWRVHTSSVAAATFAVVLAVVMCVLVPPVRAALEGLGLRFSALTDAVLSTPTAVWPSVLVPAAVVLIAKDYAICRRNSVRINLALIASLTLFSVVLLFSMLSPLLKAIESFGS